MTITSEKVAIAFGSGGTIMPLHTQYLPDLTDRSVPLGQELVSQLGVPRFASIEILTFLVPNGGQNHEF